MIENEVGTRRDNGSQAGGMDEALGQVDPREALQFVAGYARENPHTALAVAAGVGFLLGGGLTPRLLGTVGVFLARRYFRDTLTQSLQGMLTDQLGERG